MKRKIVVLGTCVFLAACVAGCGNTSSDISGGSAAASGISSTGTVSAPLAIESISPAESQTESDVDNRPKPPGLPVAAEGPALNKEALSLVGMSNAQLKEILGEQGTSSLISGGIPLVGYEMGPPVDSVIGFILSDENGEALQAFYDTPIEDKTQLPTTNIFPNTSIVEGYCLSDLLYEEKKVATAQPELKFLFPTEGAVTYQFLADTFAQQPPLDFEPGFDSATEPNPATPVLDTYKGVYNFHGTTVVLYFTEEENGEYLAYMADVGKELYHSTL